MNKYGDIFCITYNIKSEFGGMTSSMLRRAKIFGEQKNIPVKILTFALNFELRDNVEKLKGNKLGYNTEILNIYEFYSSENFSISSHKDYSNNIFKKIGNLLKNKKESNCGEIVNTLEEKSFKYSKIKNKNIYNVYDNGKHILTKNFEKYNGKLRSISYINDELKVYKKEEFDKIGIHRKTSYYNTIKSEVIQVLLYRSDGSCYMSKIYDKNEVILIRIFDTKGNIVDTFKNESELRKNFLDSITNKSQHNFFIVDSKTMFTDIINYKNLDREIYKIYINHNPHMKEPYTYNSEIRKTMKPLYKNVRIHDAIIVLTNEQKEDLNLRYGRLDNCYVIPHSYSNNKQCLNHKRDYMKVVSVARFDQQKQNEHIIKAFSKVINYVPDARLELYGFGEKESDLKNLIKHLNLENNVYIKGFSNNIARVFSTAGILLMSSKYEGQPLVILESLSYGCPVVSYKTKYGPKDMILDGKNGYLVEYNNIDQLADKTIELLNNPNEIKYMSENALETLENYTDEIFMKRWLNLFDELKVKRKKSKIFTKHHFYIYDGRWDNINKGIYYISIKSNIENEDDILLYKENISCELKNRDTENRVSISKSDINFISNELIISLYISIEEIIKNDDICKSKYWDLYINCSIDGMIFEQRIGKSLNSEHKEEDRSIEFKDIYIIKPYYTKYNNFSFYIDKLK